MQMHNETEFCSRITTAKKQPLEIQDWKKWQTLHAWNGSHLGTQMFAHKIVRNWKNILPSSTFNKIRALTTDLPTSMPGGLQHQQLQQIPLLNEKPPPSNHVSSTRQIRRSCLRWPNFSSPVTCNKACLENVPSKTVTNSTRPG